MLCLLFKVNVCLCLTCVVKTDANAIQPEETLFLQSSTRSRSKPGWVYFAFELDFEISFLAFRIYDLSTYFFFSRIIYVVACTLCYFVDDYILLSLSHPIPISLSVSLQLLKWKNNCTIGIQWRCNKWKGYFIRYHSSFSLMSRSKTSWFFKTYRRPKKLRTYTNSKNDPSLGMDRFNF